MKNTVLLEEMSWPEVQTAIEAGTRTVIIVTASMEQHGPHLPIMTDTAIGYALGDRLARRFARRAAGVRCRNLVLPCRDLLLAHRAGS